MRFVVDENIVLGKGMFSTIYHGTLNAETIAAKKCHCDELLHKEAGFLRRCDHPNVVKFRGIIEFNKEVYMLMEFAQLGELPQYLSLNRFSPAERRSFVLQISLGLEYTHSLNILHRNLTAENILLKDFQNVLIADFGEAQDYTVNARRPIDHPIVKDREYTFKSDVYLLALLAYQIFVDRRRIDAKLADDIQKEFFENGGLRHNVFEPKWEKTIVNSLHWKVQERPTAKEFHDAFDG